MNSGTGIKQLPSAAAAYIAGLLDGEGTITLTRLHAGENRRLVVSIANTELPILRFVRDQIGAGKITRKRTQQTHHTPSFCYAITSRQALALLRQISPYLLSYKKRRAQLALTVYESVTPRNGKYDSVIQAARQRFEREFLSMKAV